MQLRPAQLEILGYEGGAMAVSAVPGAGKTFILTHLAVRLIELGAKPREILILTFMRSAANTFKERIHKALAEKGLSAFGLQAMTIHAFCLSVVKQSGLFGDEEEGLTVLSEPEQIRILLEGLDCYLTEPDRLKDWEKRYPKVKEDQDPKSLTCAAAKKVISAIKNYGVKDPEEALKGQPEMIFLARYYEKRLRELSSIDYDDQIQQAIELLRSDPKLLASYRHRYRYILEDEAQDSNPAQHSLITLLTDKQGGGSGNLIRVGDSNQAIIASFSHNDPRFFREFCHAEGIHHIAMDESSRSAVEVIQLANTLVKFTQSHPDPVISETFERITIKPATAGKQNPTASALPTWTHYKTKEDEQLGVLSDIRKYLRLNPEAKAAILTFSNYQAAEYRDRALRMEIPIYQEISNIGRTRQTLSLIARVLEFLSLSGDHTQGFLAILETYQPEWNNIKAIRQHLKTIELEKIIYPEGFPPYRPSAISEKDYAGILQVAQILQRLLGARHLPATELLPTIAKEFSRDPQAPVLAMKAANIARRYLPTTENPLLALRDEVEKMLQASMFRELLPSPEVAPVQPGQLEILTMHRSKGAEYDAVWMPGIGYYYGKSTNFPWDLEEAVIRDREAFKGEQSVICHSRGEKPEYEQLELDAKRLLISERIRLLYVGITRAEREIHLSASGSRDIAPPHVKELMELCQTERALA